MTQDVAGQQIGKNVIAVTNAHVRIEEFFNSPFSKLSVSHEGKQAIISSQNFLFLLVDHNIDRLLWQDFLPFSHYIPTA
jgi:hypothetical protein